MFWQPFFILIYNKEHILTALVHCILNMLSFSFNLTMIPADHDYCRLVSVLLFDQITDIGNEMCV